MFVVANNFPGINTVMLLDLFFYLISKVLFAVIFLIFPYYILRRRRSLVLYSPKLVLYYCAELSFASKLWPEYRERLQADSGQTINVPMIATMNGIFTYPLARGLLLVILIILIISMTSQLGLLQFDDPSSSYSILLAITICCGPIVLFYLTSFGSESYAMVKNQQAVSEFLIELGWDKLSKESLQQILKEVEIDFHLFKKNDDFGTILVVLVMGMVLIYSRIQEYLPPRVILVLLAVFAIIILSKSYYEGFRTRVIYISLNTLLHFIAKCSSEGRQIQHGPGTRQLDRNSPSRHQ